METGYGDGDVGSGGFREERRAGDLFEEGGHRGAAVKLAGGDGGV